MKKIDADLKEGIENQANRFFKKIFIGVARAHPKPEINHLGIQQYGIEGTDPLKLNVDGKEHTVSHQDGGLLLTGIAYVGFYEACAGEMKKRVKGDFDNLWTLYQKNPLASQLLIDCVRSEFGKPISEVIEVTCPLEDFDYSSAKRY
jgi:hypothetical protein